MWRTFEGRVETLGFDEVGHKELRNAINKKSDMKLVFEDSLTGTQGGLGQKKEGQGTTSILFTDRSTVPAYCLT